MGRAAKRKRDPQHREEMHRRRLARKDSARAAAERQERQEAAQAALDEIDAKVARSLSELRKAEHVLGLELDPPREGSP